MTGLNRRDMLRLVGGGAAALLVAGQLPAVQDKKDGAYPFELPKLPYPTNALEPHIDGMTMEIHHGRHHKAYVDNLNAALKDHADLQKMSLQDLVRGWEKLPMAVRTAVRNNGGGHLNHTWFWSMMAKDGGGKPSGDVAKAIDTAFGSFDKFQEAFTRAAMTRFGSGWAWLVVGKEKLEVVSSANQDNPLAEGQRPILGIDVWEHAYYLKYQNKRADYVKAFWNVVNWRDVGERYAAAKK
jgi:Fe-Mn family superoxide dismutase